MKFIFLSLSLFLSLFLFSPLSNSSALSSLLSRDGNISVARRTLSSLSLSPHSLPSRDGNYFRRERSSSSLSRLFLLSSSFSPPSSISSSFSLFRVHPQLTFSLSLFLSRPHSRDGNFSVPRRGERREISSLSSFQFSSLFSLSLSSLSPTFCRSFRKLFLSLSPFFPLSLELPSLATEIFPSPDESLSFLSAASSLLCALSSLPVFSVRTLFFSLHLSLPLILSSLSLPPSCDENFPVARRGGRSFFFLSLFRRDNSFCRREREMKGERIEWRRERRESENV